VPHEPTPAGPSQPAGGPAATDVRAPRGRPDPAGQAWSPSAESRGLSGLPLAGGAVATADRVAPAVTDPRAVPPLHGPWPAVSPRARRWPGPGRPASAATIGALAGAAVVAAISLPLDAAGLGWLVTAFGGAIALTLARRLTGVPATTVPAGPAAWQPQQLALNELGKQRFAWSAATVALLGVGTLRAAGWLFVLCLITSIGTVALAVTGGRSSRGMIVSWQSAFIAPFRSLPWIVRGADLMQRQRAGGAQGTRVMATVAVSLVLLLVFGGLFASADAAFADVLSQALPDLSLWTGVRWVFLFVLAGGVLGGAAFLRAAPPNLSDLDGGGSRRVGRFEWAVPLGLLAVLFAAFVGVQLAVLFGGSRHVLETAGLTYADYARSGFWQLAVVTVLTLLVLAGAARWAPRETRVDRVLIRAVLGTLAGLTLVIMASAVHRMNVYSDTYGLTRLRVLVAACELWLGVVLVLVLIAGVRLRGAWVPRISFAAGVLALLALAAVNPDGLIADRNIARFQDQHRLDVRYLSNLSADAVPALGKLPPALRDCVIASMDLTNGRGDWRYWSYGRQHAAAVLAEDTPDYSAADCRY
jgi:hypothetical protein